MGINKKQKQKKVTRRKIRTSSLTRIKKKKLMLVHLFLLYKNLNKNFEAGIEDISKNMLGM